MRRIALFLALAFIYTEYSFSQSDYLIPFRDGNKWGYCDTLLNKIIPVQFDEASFFYGGYAHVRIGKENALMDKTGKILFKGDFTISFPYRGIVTITKNNKTGLADINKGKIILKPAYSSIYHGNDLAVIQDSNYRHGLYHIRRGKWLLAIKYERIDMNDSTIIVTGRQGKIYYDILKNGTLVRHSPKKNPALPGAIKDKLTGDSAEASQMLILAVTVLEPVAVDDLISSLYDSIGYIKGYNDSLLLAKKEGKMGIIDAHGAVKIPLLYDEISATERSDIDSIYFVRQNNKWGIVQFGKVLLPCEYEKMEFYSFNRDGFYLKQNNKNGFYVYSDRYKIYHVLIPCRYEFIEPELKWISLENTTIGMTYEPQRIRPYFLMAVYVPEWKRGFIDLKGNEFFRDDQ